MHPSSIIVAIGLVRQRRAIGWCVALQKTKEEAESEKVSERLLAEQKRKSEQDHRDSVSEILKRLKLDQTHSPIP